ncbi:unnamed protein product, partial [Nesidiocoris tenuis]
MTHKNKIFVNFTKIVISPSTPSAINLSDFLDLKFSSLRESSPRLTGNRISHSTYGVTRKKYKKTCKIKKRTSWKAFINSEVARDPWGFLYKQAAGKLKAKSGLSTVLTESHEYTTRWWDTAGEYLRVLLPQDDPAGDDVEQRHMRKICTRVTTEMVGKIEAPFTNGETAAALQTLKTGKAPGPNGHKAEIIKNLSEQNRQKIQLLYNACLEIGHFPEPWKEGRAVVLYKGNEKPIHEPSSHRIIQLLDVEGKGLEKLIRGRLEKHVTLEPEQYGFVKGKGTTDALLKIKGAAASPKKYVMLICVDISGAFDNLWWPALLQELRKAEVPANLFRLVKSYLKNRKTVIKEGNGRQETTSTKGCPQGSVLGPYFWNITANVLIKKMKEKGHVMIMYADDGTIILEADSRLELEEKGQAAMDVVSGWCRQAKMRLSAQKTTMLLIKGTLDIRRPPRIKVEGTTLRMTEEARILGVVVDQRLGFASHVRYVSQKATQLFQILRRVARAQYAIEMDVAKTIYRGAYEGIISYACPVWEPESRKAHNKRRLLSSQRSALLAITRAYNTTSTDALQVAAGIPPVTLRLKEKAKLFERRQRRRDASAVEPNAKTEKEEKRELRAETLQEWQELWEQSTKGRATYDYWPNVESRMKQRCQIDAYTIQAVTGHGDFAAKLKSFALVDDDRCPCGEIDDADHTIYVCPLYREERQELSRCGYSKAEIPACSKKWKVFRDAVR